MGEFWPPKITIKFLGNSWNYNFEVQNVQYLLKCDIFFKYVHDSDICRKKSMTFRSLLKIVRKGAYFYLFILSANIERLYTYLRIIHR